MLPESAAVAVASPVTARKWRRLTEPFCSRLSSRMKSSALIGRFSQCFLVISSSLENLVLSQCEGGRQRPADDGAVAGCETARLGFEPLWRQHQKLAQPLGRDQIFRMLTKKDPVADDRRPNLP